MGKNSHFGEHRCEGAAKIVMGPFSCPTRFIEAPFIPLHAADPDVSATDPTIVEAMAVLKKHWITMANTFQSTPVAIIRAVLLDAVVQVSREDDAIAVAFVNTVVMPF